MSSAATQRIKDTGTHRQRSLVALMRRRPWVIIVFPFALTFFTLAAVVAALPRPKSMLAGVAAITAGILLAVGLAGGTYASLNVQATTPAVTVSSGGLAVTVQAAGTTAATTTSIPTAAWSNMLPGDIVGQQVQVVNSSPTSVALSFSVGASSAWDIRVAWGTCPTTQITNNSLTTTSVYGATIASGFSNTMCVQAMLPASAASSVSGTAVNFNILIAVKQVAP